MSQLGGCVVVLSQIEDRRISSESADEILLHEDGSPLSADSVEVTKQTRPLCVDLEYSDYLAAGTAALGYGLC